MKSLRVGDIVLYNGATHIVSDFSNKDGRGLVELQRLVRVPELVPLEALSWEDEKEDADLANQLEVRSKRQLLRQLYLYISLVKTLKASGGSLRSVEPEVKRFCENLEVLKANNKNVIETDLLKRLNACRALLEANND